MTNLNNSGIQIIDNFLPEEDFKNIYNTVMEQTFPWNWSPVLEEHYVAQVREQYDKKELYQFTHMLYYRGSIASKQVGLIQPILDIIMAIQNLKMVKKSYQKKIESVYLMEICVILDRHVMIPNAG